MKVSKKALKEFKQIYFQEYGVKLKNKEALDKAIRLLVIVKAIYKPIPIKNMNKIICKFL